MDASLAERLATFADAVRTQWPTFSDAAERLVRRLRERELEKPHLKRATPCRRLSFRMKWGN